VICLKKIEIFTDGACSGNPGKGGWAAILKFEKHEKEISGGDVHTTNNRMEMSAVINALKLLKEPCDVKIYSDSRYVCDGISNGWAKKWQKNNWFRSKNELAKNPDLWQEILLLIEKHTIKMIWIKGHEGNIYNERCDKLAKNEIININS
jgi:ribonuclease HI